MVSSTLVALACLISGVLAAPSSSATAPVASTIMVSTAVASPSAAATAVIPSQVPLPPTQSWCPSQIFCAGQVCVLYIFAFRSLIRSIQLLQTVNIAQLYTDPKTIVDKPTIKAAALVLADFSALGSAGNITESSVENFVDSDFRGEGLELEALELPNFNPQPAFLGSVQNTLLRAFTQTVHGYWAQLIRGTNDSALCAGGSTCESSLIPLNHTFVVPGGRFREQCQLIVLSSIKSDFNGWSTLRLLGQLLDHRRFDPVRTL